MPAVTADAVFTHVNDESTMLYCPADVYFMQDEMIPFVHRLNK